MSSRKDKWFLVQLSNDAYEVVSYRAVDPACDMTIGAVVTIINPKTRTQDTATIIGSSRDRKVLEQQIAPPPRLYEDSAVAAGPSLKHEEMGQEERDFSASDESDWAPSDEPSTDEDEGDKEVDTKVKRIRRSYSNKRTSKTIKPTHRADAVVISLNSNRKRRLDQSVKRYDKPKSYRKEINSNRDLENKSAPDSTRNNVNPMINCPSMITQTVNTVNVNVQDILNMKQCFDELFKIINELKPTVNSVSKETETDALHEAQAPESIPTPSRSTVKNERSVVENITADFDEYEYRSDESHRSDDNILITNKYDTVHDKVLSDHGKSKKKTEHARKSKNTTASNHTPNKKMVVDSQDKILESSQPKEWIPIGSGKTLMHKEQYRKVNWKSYTIATRTLLLALFPRKILATHSMTGKRSPAFANKPAKMCLDPKIVSDVIIEITARFKVKENLVRSIITTKCADECKMLKMRMKRKSLNPSLKDQENLSPDENDDMTNQTF